jgi:hypothetical protein
MILAAGELKLGTPGFGPAIVIGIAVAVAGLIAGKIIPALVILVLVVIVAIDLRSRLTRQ